MVVLVYVLQDIERTIIQYLNKNEPLEGPLNDGYRTWKNYISEKLINTILRKMLLFLFYETSKDPCKNFETYKCYQIKDCP